MTHPRAELPDITGSSDVDDIRPKCAKHIANPPVVTPQQQVEPQVVLHSKRRRPSPQLQTLNGCCGQLGEWSPVDAHERQRAPRRVVFERARQTSDPIRLRI